MSQWDARRQAMDKYYAQKATEVTQRVASVASGEADPLELAESLLDLEDDDMLTPSQRKKLRQMGKITLTHIKEKAQGA